LLIHEGRLSVVEISAQLGHNPTVCLDRYAHVMAEERDGDRDRSLRPGRCRVRRHGSSRSKGSTVESP
jgi:hypothetical protein